MNYEHLYHAGGVLDVIKHLALITWMSCHTENQRRNPLSIIDGFGGSGVYDLQDPKAQKTGEAKKGVVKLFKMLVDAHGPNHMLSPVFERYFSTLCLFNHPVSSGIRYYPGSSFLLADGLRANDELVMVEQVQEVFNQWRHDLKKSPFKGRIHGICASIEAVLNPDFFQKRNGPVLVFLDPPYENLHEIRHWLALVESLKKIKKIHWALWYPIKGNRAMQPFYRAFENLPIPKNEQDFAEYLFLPRDVENRLNGSGFWVYPQPTNWKEKITQTWHDLKKYI